MILHKTCLEWQCKYVLPIRVLLSVHFWALLFRCSRSLLCEKLGTRPQLLSLRALWHCSQLGKNRGQINDSHTQCWFVMNKHGMLLTRGEAITFVKYWNRVANFFNVASLPFCAISLPLSEKWVILILPPVGKNQFYIQSW